MQSYTLFDIGNVHLLQTCITITNVTEYFTMFWPLIVWLLLMFGFLLWIGGFCSLIVWLRRWFRMTLIHYRRFRYHLFWLCFHLLNTWRRLLLWTLTFGKLLVSMVLTFGSCSSVWSELRLLRIAFSMKFQMANPPKYGFENFDEENERRDFLLTHNHHTIRLTKFKELTYD